MGLFSRYKIPRGETAKGHAQSLIDLAQYHTELINDSQSVFDLYYSYNRLSEIVDELIWLNEKKKVPMYPSPRRNWNEIEEEFGRTIDRFIDRYLRGSARFGEERADVIEKLMIEIEYTDGFTDILRPENEKRIAELKEEAASIREGIRIEYQLQRREENFNALGIEKNIDASTFHPFEVNDKLENTIKKLYHRCLEKGLSVSDSQKAFDNFKKACETSKLPLASEIWLESLLAEYATKFSEQNILQAIDSMDGHAFELWSASLLEKIGFSDVVVTKASGDYGVDLLAVKDGIKYAVQCKRYASNLGNTPVQEVNSGKAIYNCHVGAVITNQHFTKAAKALAERNGVLLWDRDWIIAMLNELEEI